jgi:hypothetical protein
LEEAAGDHYVLQKMDHLVLVTEVCGEKERRGQAEHRHDQRRQANPVACQ